MTITELIGLAEQVAKAKSGAKSFYSPFNHTCSQFLGWLESEIECRAIAENDEPDWTGPPMNVKVTTSTEGSGVQKQEGL